MCVSLSAQVSTSVFEEFACISRREKDKRGETQSLCSRQTSAHDTTLLVPLLYAISFKGDRLSVQRL